jgi:CheY-like chemotaxis protein
MATRKSARPRQAAGAPPSASHREATGAAAKPLVLVVDDEPANLSTMARVFRKELALTLARSGAEALDLAQRQRFDVALVDYSLPEMDGVEVLRRLAAVQPAMARLMVTAHDQLQPVLDCKAAGLAVSIIPKPWQKEQVLRWIATALRLASMRSSVARMRDGSKG